MDTLTLYKFLKNMTRGRRAYVNVLPCDGLDNLKIETFPAYLIVNSKDSSHGGEHWISLYLRKSTGNKTILEFFCSYGLGIEYYASNFVNFAKRLVATVIENRVPLQSIGSNVCGSYALFFLYNRMKGHCQMSAYCNFSNDFHENDARIRRFIKLKTCLFKNNCKLQKDLINQCCVKF
jgi:hypothetical protein